MTVNLVGARIAANGDGVSTVFAVNYYFLASTDLLVQLSGAKATLGVDYNVTGAGVTQPIGGTVVFTVAPPVGVGNVVIIRDPDQLQGTGYPPNDSFPSAAHERALDKLTMLMQRTRDLLARSFGLADSDVSGVSLTMPSVVAGAFLGWNALGTALTNYAGIAGAAVSSAMAPVLQAGTLALGRAALGSTAVGDAVFTAVSAAAARAALGFGIANKSGITIGTGAGGTAEQAAPTVDGMVLNSDASQATGVAWALAPVTPAQYRLSLATATPVPSADLSAQATLYNTPYGGKGILIPTSTGWVIANPGEMSQAATDATKSPAAVANNLNYDLFTWNDGGTIRTTRGPAWTAGAVGGSDTVRGTGAASTELQYVDGRWVNKNAITNGPAALRGLYAGTVRSNGTATFDDAGVGGSTVLRNVWNMYNRVARPAVRYENSASWSYVSATIRQANANAANQFGFVRGLNEDLTTAQILALMQNGSTANVMIGFGLDSTIAFTPALRPDITSGATLTNNMAAFYSGLPGLGFHTLTYLEQTQATGSFTFMGNGTGAGGAPGASQTGIIGSIIG